MMSRGKRQEVRGGVCVCCKSFWGDGEWAMVIMGFGKNWCCWIVWILIVWEMEMSMGLPPCNYPAIYNFGDSNSDTGGLSAAFAPIPAPNGDTFFGRPSGRACDGRLVIDFMAEHLGLSYLSPYLDSIGTNFRHGANFATAGSTIRRLNITLFDGGISPFPLTVQLWQFDQFKARTSDLYDRAKNNSAKIHLPVPREFSRALYTFDIGQNDLANGFHKMPEKHVRASIRKIIDHFSVALQKLYQQGARTFWIHNTGPVGCLPASLMYFTGGPELFDQNGCIKSHNEIAMEFNRQLKERVIHLRAQLSHARLTYVDVYTAKSSLISDFKNQGFVEPRRICCGHHEGDRHVWCGQKEIINGTEIFGASCANPSTHISWDGVHYSHAANHWIANHILNGALSDPPIPVAEACHKHVK